MRHGKTADQVLDELRALARSENREGMSRFGIDVSKAYGVSMPDIRRLAKSIQRDHALATTLWNSGIHEARILASLVEEPHEVTPAQADIWVAQFNSWDLCDQVCGNLFDRLEFADDAIAAWQKDEREFVRRAAFATIAWRAVHLKKEPDEIFLKYLPMIETGSTDRRNFVKKAVNWALRQIGKRSAKLHGPALELALKLAGSGDKTANWIGKNAAKELQSEAVKRKLGLT